MRIGVVSDSPALTTGYGIVTDRCCQALLAAGHDVACFGFKDRRDNPARHAYAAPIEPIDPFEKWHPKLRAFVAEGRFDVLWIYMDVYNLAETMTALDGVELPPVSLYAIFDGLPAYRKLLRPLARCRTLLVTTDFAADYLRGEGLAVHGVAPPGVATDLFRPLDRDRLRREAAIRDGFLVGVFGRNTERKQQPRVLEAVKRLTQTGEMADLIIYFHCARSGYWNLEELACRFGLRDRVLFPDTLVDETRGIPLRGTGSGSRALNPGIPAGFGYVERLNICDIVLNVPHSGDFEQILIEAGACGVPVAATDDHGIMRSALGPGLPLAASEVSLGNAGQLIHFVAVEAIESAIRSWRNEATRLSAAARSREWAQAHGWCRLQTAIVEAVESAARQRSP